MNAYGTEALGKQIFKAVTAELKENVESEHSRLTLMSVFSISVASILSKSSLLGHLATLTQTFKSPAMFQQKSRGRDLQSTFSV